MCTGELTRTLDQINTNESSLNFFLVSLDKENYKIDYLNYINYVLIKKVPLYIILTALVIALLIMYQLEVLTPHSQIFGHSILIGGGAMLILDIFYNIRAKLYLNRNSPPSNYKGKIPMNLDERKMEFDFTTHKETIYFSAIKSAIILKGTLFLEMNKKKEWPFKINSEEISSVGFKKVIELLDHKQIKIKKKMV